MVLQSEIIATRRPGESRDTILCCYQPVNLRTIHYQPVVRDLIWIADHLRNSAQHARSFHAIKELFIIDYLIYLLVHRLLATDE